MWGSTKFSKPNIFPSFDWIKFRETSEWSLRTLLNHHGASLTVARRVFMKTSIIQIVAHPTFFSTRPIFILNCERGSSNVTLLLLQITNACYAHMKKKKGVLEYIFQTKKGFFYVTKVGCKEKYVQEESHMLLPVPLRNIFQLLSDGIATSILPSAAGQNSAISIEGI